jgi:hypothetical protein
MFHLISILVRALISGLQSRQGLVLENLALRHQLMVLQRTASKPKLREGDRFLWVLLQRCWPDWQRTLVLVRPRTILSWHRRAFRQFWRWKSSIRTGRPGLNQELVALIRQMWSANSTWGSKRIQAELAKLGIRLSDSTVRKYRPISRRHRREQTWKNFLHTMPES